MSSFIGQGFALLGPISLKRVFKTYNIHFYHSALWKLPLEISHQKVKKDVFFWRKSKCWFSIVFPVRFHFLDKYWKLFERSKSENIMFVVCFTIERCSKTKNAKNNDFCLKKKKIISTKRCQKKRQKREYF